jgi:YHS domain-containing protein
MANTAGDHDVFVDPVSHEQVDPQHAAARSFYRGVMYHFASVVDKMTFEDDPELWIPTPHASMTSANISPDDEI